MWQLANFLKTDLAVNSQIYIQLGEWRSKTWSKHFRVSVQKHHRWMSAEFLTGKTGCWVAAYSQRNLEHTKWICESLSLWSFPEQDFLHSPDALCEWENQEEVLLFYLFWATLRFTTAWVELQLWWSKNVVFWFALSKDREELTWKDWTSPSAALQLANREASPNDRAQNSCLCGNFLYISVQRWSHWSSNVPQALFSPNVLQGFNTLQLQDVLLRLS